MGRFPVMDEVKREARRRKIDLIILPADEAVSALVEEFDAPRCHQFCLALAETSAVDGSSE
jgi:hypothetical protein